MGSSKRKTRTDYWNDPDAPRATRRRTSASVFVQDGEGRLLLMCRADNGLWTMPSGGVKTGETVAEAGVRECAEETGILVEVTGLLGVFSDPGHVVAMARGGKVTEVRQPINICLRARPRGGELRPAPDEARDARWVGPADLDGYPIPPAVRARLRHGLDGGPPIIA
jgi:ADP-ribose pyrophosphatase YjhB (NUDIX family)